MRARDAPTRRVGVPLPLLPCSPVAQGAAPDYLDRDAALTPRTARRSGRPVAHAPIDLTPMLQIQRVVHPTDFSDGARAAFAHALHLARQHGATLDVLHAAPQLGTKDISMAFYPEGFEAQYRAEQEAAVDAYVREAETEGVTLTVAPCVYGGPVALEILNYAHAIDADLIVMGSHGRRGIKRLVLGSVAEMVIQRAACPVLTVQARPDGTDRPDHVRCIVVAVDFPYFAEELVRYADALAKLYGSAVVLLHVINDVNGVTDAEVARSGLEPPDRWLADVEADALHRLEHLRLHLIDPATAVSYHVSSGYTLDRVPAAIEQIAPDLVVTATHGFKGIDRMVMGSITDQILRRGHRATFVVKPTGTSLLEPLDADGPLARSVALSRSV